MSRASKILGAVLLAALVVGVTATAVANRSAFREVADNPADASVGLAAAAEPTQDEAGLGVINPVPTPSLDAVREADLLPFQWPWFAADVPAPVDALANGQDLVAALAQVPGLAGFKVLSAERMDAEEDGVDLGIRRAWLAVGSDEVMRIGTQRLTPHMTIPIGQGEVLTPYGMGQAIVESKPGQTRVLYATSSRQVIIALQAAGDLAVPVSRTSEQLLELAAQLADVLER